MKINKKILLLILFFLLIFDIVFSFTYLIYPKYFGQKNFNTKNADYQFDKNRIKLFSGGETTIGTVRIIGKVLTHPSYIRSVESYVLPIKYSFLNKELILNVIIENKDESIYLILAKKGIIPDSFTGEALSIKNVLSYFKKNNPVIIDLYYSPLEKLNVFLDDKKCLSNCHVLIQSIIKYLPGTNALLNNAIINNGTFIGPAHSFILYDK